MTAAAWRRVLAIAAVAGVLALTIPATAAAGGGDSGHGNATGSAALFERVGQPLGPPGGEVRSLVASSGDRDRLYLGTAHGHVYTSSNGGLRWEPTGLSLPHDAVVDNLTVDPDDPRHVYAAYWRPRESGGLVRSRDTGQTWSELDVPGSPSLRALALAPSNPRVIFVGGIDGIWRSDDGGDTWADAGGSGEPFQFVESLAVDPRDPDRVYAGTWRQAYRSTDGGSSWHRIARGMAIDRDVFSIRISPHDPDRLMAGTCSYVYASVDGGDTWKERREGLAAFHRRVHVVAQDPVEPRRLYAGTRGGLYLSRDGGETWQVMLGAVAVTAVLVDVGSSRVLVATEERGVLASDDGTTFAERNVGLAASRVVAFDVLPGAPRVMFAARSEGPASDSVYLSTDAGSTWSALGAAPVLGKIEALRAQTDPVNHLIVAARHGWWSVRPGGRWKPAIAPPGRFRALATEEGGHGLLLAATSQGLFVAAAEKVSEMTGAARPFGPEADPVWRRLHDGDIAAVTLSGNRYLAAGDDELILGTLSDRAATRRSTASVVAPVGLPTRITDLALNPVDPDIAYSVSGSTIYRTEDGGASWEPLRLPWPAADLRAVAVDPTDPDRVLALDFAGAIYRGHGGGRHWLVLDDDPELHRAWELRLSSETPGLAMVATRGHGLRIVSLFPGRRPEAATPAAPSGGSSRP